jgi:hypothetical protein
LAESGQLAEIEERRRRLVAESSRLRGELAIEVGNVCASLTWVARVYEIMRSLRSVWPVAATVAGFVVVRKGGWFRSLGKLWSLWRAGQQALTLWRSRAARGETSDAAS